MENKEKLSAICRYYCNGKKRKMAEELGISEQSLGKWFSRGTIDYELISKKYKQINLDWLLRDDEDMIAVHSELDELNASAAEPSSYISCQSESIVLPMSAYAALIDQLKIKDKQLEAYASQISKYIEMLTSMK